MYKTTDRYEGIPANPEHDPSRCPICGGQLEPAKGWNGQESEVHPWACTACGATGKTLDEWADEPSFLCHIDIVPGRVKPGCSASRFGGDPGMSVSPDREYVIVCNEHSGMWAGCLLFWGHMTDDNEKRSYGGYTTGVDKAERYTEKELNQNGWHFPIYHEGMDLQAFLKERDIAIRPGDLAKLGYKPMQVWYRP